MITSVIAGLFALSQISADDAQTAVDAVVDSSRTTVRAKVIARTPPAYPRFELQAGKEAWVHVAYCIDESGKPQNITVLDSVGGHKFDRAASKTVEKWKFEPALVDGTPSWQSGNQAYISFAIEDNEKGASRYFVKRFRTISRFLNEGELEEADKRFHQLLDNYDLSLYELTKLWEQRVRYESLKGDMHKLDIALHRATASDGRWIDNASYIRLLKIRVRVEANIGQFHAAKRVFNTLIAVAGEGSEEVASLRPLINEVQNLIDSDKVLKITAKIDTRDECSNCNESWSFVPVRPTFTFSNVSGALTSITMRCDHKHYQSKVSDLVDWTIPESWGTCNVDVYGDPQTTFDVLMLPVES